MHTLQVIFDISLPVLKSKYNMFSGAGAGFGAGLGAGASSGKKFPFMSKLDFMDSDSEPVCYLIV